MLHTCIDYTGKLSLYFQKVKMTLAALRAGLRRAYRRMSVSGLCQIKRRLLYMPFFGPLNVIPSFFY